jgi:putative transcriptional regulator
MTQTGETFSLTGKLLIAMPGMGDPRFERSVILICAHSGTEAMGLIVNKPATGLTFRELLTQLKITPGAGADMPVHLGGPVEHGRGFVLHSADYTSNGATLQVPGGFALTATLDVLEDVARGLGPARAILALGYSGWGPGQLEREIAQNGWLTCDAHADLVFGGDAGGKWEAALRSMGIDPLTLSAVAGRA